MAGHCRTALSDIKDKLIQTSHPIAIQRGELLLVGHCVKALKHEARPSPEDTDSRFPLRDSQDYGGCTTATRPA